MPFCPVGPAHGERMKTTHKVGLALLGSVALLFVARTAYRHALGRRNQLYMAVIAGLKSGKIGTNPAGTVSLPPNLNSASVGGEVYVSSRPDGLLLVAFKTWRGKGRNMQGFLF